MTTRNNPIRLVDLAPPRTGPDTRIPKDRVLPVPDAPVAHGDPIELLLGRRVRVETQPRDDVPRCRRGHTDIRRSVRSSGRVQNVCRVCERDSVEAYRARNAKPPRVTRLDPDNPAPCGVCGGPRRVYWCPSEGRHRAKCLRCNSRRARAAGRQK